MLELPFVGELETRFIEKTPLMQFVVGPRQVGKTTGVEQFLEKYKGPFHYKLVEGELNANSSWLRLQWQTALGLGTDALLVIDEIQKIYQWAETLKTLWDLNRKSKIKLKCLFLGSSSLHLQKGVSESLTGRYELIRVPHWDFLQSLSIADHMSLSQYLSYGGYPGSYSFLTKPERFKSYIRDSIVKNVLEKDILLNHTIKNPALFRQAVELFANYPAQEISYTKLLGQLQEKGNVEIVKHYLELLDGAFLFKAISKFSNSSVVQKSSSPKIIPLCPALVFALAESEPPLGRVFEMAVGSFLNTFVDRLYYWRHGDFEVDYVAVIDKNIFGIEVKSGRKKHSQGPEQFLKKFPKAKGFIVDQQNFETLLRKKKDFFKAY
jgi:predicted AAA+ superfamily ATPase